MLPPRLFVPNGEVHILPAATWHREHVRYVLALNEPHLQARPRGHHQTVLLQEILAHRWQQREGAVAVQGRAWRVDHDYVGPLAQRQQGLYEVARVRGVRLHQLAQAVVLRNAPHRPRKLAPALQSQSVEAMLPGCQEGRHAGAATAVENARLGTAGAVEARDCSAQCGRVELVPLRVPCERQQELVGLQHVASIDAAHSHGRARGGQPTSTTRPWRRGGRPPHSHVGADAPRDELDPQLQPLALLHRKPHRNGAIAPVLPRLLLELQQLAPRYVAREAPRASRGAEDVGLGGVCPDIPVKERRVYRPRARGADAEGAVLWHRLLRVPVPVNLQDADALAEARERGARGAERRLPIDVVLQHLQV
mmetsp:Transcript_74979/g.242450  ORF Transcript_74979/g.242450 Transcript_74979/m.242450 type:complete len:365 (-) Transcript_74979:747-1841(-)